QQVTGGRPRAGNYPREGRGPDVMLRRRAARLFTWCVEDSGSPVHVVEASVAVPAGHPHLTTLPGDEGSFLDVNGEEVPSFRRPPPAHGLDRGCRGLSQRLI